MIATTRVRTRYGTRRYQQARCSVPGCEYRGPRREKGSTAKDDEQRHYAEAHPRP
jgi:hypothetical protein